MFGIWHAHGLSTTISINPVVSCIAVHRPSGSLREGEYSDGTTVVVLGSFIAKASQVRHLYPVNSYDLRVIFSPSDKIALTGRNLSLTLKCSEEVQGFMIFDDYYSQIHRALQQIPTHSTLELCL